MDSGRDAGEDETLHHRCTGSTAPPCAVALHAGGCLDGELCARPAREEPARVTNKELEWVWSTSLSISRTTKGPVPLPVPLAVLLRLLSSGFSFFRHTKA